MVSCTTAIRIAVEDINKDSTLPINITLDIRSSDPPDNHPQSGSNAMFQASLLVSSNISAICDIDLGSTDTPVLICIKYAFSDSLSNNLVYGTFIRSISANDMIFRQYLSYIRMMGWRRISVFFSDDSLGRSASLVIASHASEYGVRIINSYRLQEYHNDDDLKPQLNMIQDTGSYINLILANGHYLVHALTDIQKAGFFGAPYVWLTMNDVSNELLAQYQDDNLPQPNWDGLIVGSILEGFLKTAAYYDFEKRWKSLDPAEYPGAGKNSTSIYIELKAYTCVWLLALGYQKDIELAKKRGLSDAYIKSELQQGSYPRTVGNLTSVFFSTLSYTGPGGYYTLDQHGNTNSTPILIYQRQKNNLVRVARSDVERNGTYSSVMLGKQIWPGWPKATVVPHDAPDWVLQNISWKKPFGQAIGTLVILGLSMSVGLIVFVIWKRKNPVIQSAGPVFCVVELFAIILVFSTVVMRIGVFKDWTCVAYPLVLSFSLSLLIGTLAVKNLRQYRLYNNVLHDQHSKYDWKLIVQLTAIILFCMLPSLIFLFEVRPRARLVNFDGKEAVICIPIHKGVTEKTETALAVVSALPMSVLTIVTAFLAHRTRDMHVRWNESFGVSCSMYNLLLYHVVYISLLFLDMPDFRLQIIISNILLLSAMMASIIGLFGTKIVHMIHLARQNPDAPRCLSSNSTAGTVEDSNISSDGNNAQILPIEEEIRIDAALQRFGFISTGRKASRSRFGRPNGGGVRPKKISRRLHTHADVRHRHHDPPVFAAHGHGGPESVAYTTCSFYCPMPTGVVAGWQLDASEIRSKAGVHLESGIDPQQQHACMNMSSEEAISVPVLIERNHWYDRLVRKWRCMQVFVVPSLSVVILADCNENFILTCVYTDITSRTKAGHHYLYISCLRQIGLKLEFPTEEARDQWQKSLACCDHTVDHTESTIEQGNHS
ncbi:Gamma-aminobutyric acid type B receptor subunit 1 [Podila clonocystis]|nr:Gamma-aminobutyric acid type B receptor subunit 1 [Podila clonocystis]